MNFKSQDNKLQLFLVRVRAEDFRDCLQPDDKLWSGCIQRVVTGETHDFRGWAELIKRLGIMLDDTKPGSETSEQG